ncbi:MAG: putative anti sigma factor [Frankiales bacterium]|nr:putative anti sigma factor [Frankiales bacterium]
MVRAHERDGSRRLARVPASRRPWWAAHPSPAAELRLGWESGGAQAVLTVDGDLDAGSAGQLDAFVAGLPAGGCAVLYLDLTGARSLGSAGVSTLVGMRRRCDQRSIELRVRGALPSVWRVLELAGLDESLSRTASRPARPTAPGQELSLF